jgi:hypothetical protein
MTLAIQGIEVLADADQAGVVATLGALFGGFAARDAAMLSTVYTDDADWVNAFGSVKTGVVEIVGYLRGLFADDNFNAGRLAGPPTSHLRQLSGDIVTFRRGCGLSGRGWSAAARSDSEIITPCACFRSRLTGAGLSRPKSTWTLARSRATRATHKRVQVWPEHVQVLAWR